MRRTPRGLPKSGFFTVIFKVLQKKVTSSHNIKKRGLVASSNGFYLHGAEEAVEQESEDARARLAKACSRSWSVGLPRGAQEEVTRSRGERTPRSRGHEVTRLERRSRGHETAREHEVRSVEREGGPAGVGGPGLDLSPTRFFTSTKNTSLSSEL